MANANVNSGISFGQAHKYDLVKPDNGIRTHFDNWIANINTDINKQ
jgi:hypothetical protein